MAAHIAVPGGELPTLFRLLDTEDIVFDDSQLPTGFAYVALGHIHKHQKIGGQTHVRYSGSIEKMDLGESLDEKGVVLFDLGPEGIEGEPWTLPLESTPVYEIDVRNPKDEIPKLREKYKDTQRHLVRIRCQYTAGVDNREEVLRELEEIFPRWYDRQISEANALGPTMVGPESGRSKSFEDTVRDYLTQELLHHDEDLQRTVLDKAEGLMKEV